jgi:ATP-binding cassette, subfamily B, bacterial
METENQAPTQTADATTTPGPVAPSPGPATPASRQERSSASKRGTEQSVWANFRVFVGERKSSVLLLAVSSLCAAVTEAAILTIVAQAASGLVGGAHKGLSVAGFSLGGSLNTLLWVGIALAVARLLLQIPISVIPARIAGNVQAGLRERLYHAFSVASWDLQSQDREGHFQEMMTNQITMASQGAVQATGLVVSLFTFLALSASAFVLNPLAAVVVLVAAVGMFAAMRPLNHFGTKSARALSAAQLEYAGAVGESNTVAEETRVFGVGQVQRRIMDGFIARAKHHYVHTQMVARASTGVYQSTIYLVLIAGLLIIHLAGVGGVTSLGAVVLLLVRASTYGQQMQNFYQLMRQSLPFIERINDSIDTYRSSVVPDGSRSLDALRTLTFENISYAYATRTGTRQALRDLSFQITGGETIGVVGPSGAGKSTLVQVLLGLRTPQAGRYTINGIPTPDYTRADWTRVVSYVPQQPRLVYGTVADNVRFYREISQERVEQACRQARIHDEIMSWQDGYDTIVGPRAAAVSGGQQQRICLARALVDEPEVLVLDEPTSALDPRSEALIQESLTTIRESLTLFIIAHRMSTLSICDRVMVILDGTLDAFDSLERLRRENAYYQMASSLSLGDQGAGEGLLS